MEASRESKLAVASTRADTPELQELWSQAVELSTKLAAVRAAAPSARTYEKELQEQLDNALAPNEKLKMEEILPEHSRQQDNALRSDQAGGRKSAVGELKMDLDSPRQSLYGLKIGGVMEGYEQQGKEMWLEAQAKAMRQATEIFEKVSRDAAVMKKVLQELREKRAKVCTGAELAVRNDYARRFGPCAQSLALAVASTRMDTTELQELYDQSHPTIKKPWGEILPEHSRQRDNALRSDQAGGRKETIADLLEVEPDSPRQRLHGLKEAGKEEANQLQRKVNQLEAQTDTLTKARRELTNKLIHDVAALQEALREKVAEVDLLKSSLEGANAAADRAQAERDMEAATAAEAQKAAEAVVEKQAREMERLQSEVARLGAELAERDSKHAGL
ncbi:hypothetical protein GPECTOR_4g542 [Gonium pectorale]|uniref:Uncharacterized protein n=1 Tax=Gonium pectorale TaxID=33097 RepID=A0A150GX68_GONPE|nr:hypothetical protein GPECTOR_4g542 [Gonium pectorale]|eukprot:KXZ54477.1 hypothetical protein GPECTOR_4g542 [Gonium pectorale]